MNTKTAKKQADRDINGSRKSAPREVYRPRVEAPESTLALLRATWAKRRNLAPREREAMQDFLRRARTQALTGPQLAYAIDIGRRVGVGYDDPALSENPKNTAIADAPKVQGEANAQPWGPLPLRPPSARLSASPAA